MILPRYFSRRTELGDRASIGTTDRCNRCFGDGRNKVGHQRSKECNISKNTKPTVRACRSERSNVDLWKRRKRAEMWHEATQGEDGYFKLFYPDETFLEQETAHQARMSSYSHHSSHLWQKHRHIRNTFNPWYNGSLRKVEVGLWYPRMAFCDAHNSIRTTRKERVLMSRPSAAVMSNYSSDVGRWNMFVLTY